MNRIREFAGCIFVVWLAATSALAQPLPSPAPMLADAELTSICFVDPDHGWAVGDRGVIWATSDGGRNWQLQRSPTTCRLECVQFLDTLSGWAVGGWTHPYTHHTSGVVLRTRDGGRTWELIPDKTLPALTHVKFSDVRRGWAAGDASPLYPSGIFRTEDGGREWTPVPKGTTSGWTAADFRDNKFGALAGHGGQTAVTGPGEVRPSRTINLGQRPLRRLVLSGADSGWLVGDGGQVLTTSDGGFTWGAPAGPLPPGTDKFDYHAVAAFGPHCWIAGNPGTCVLHSADGGQSWDTLRTGQRGAIQTLHFIDENRGWAVGSLGLILATRDGGRNWRLQRGGGARAAMLGIFSSPERVPLEVLAQQAASEGYLSVVEVVGHNADDGTQPRVGREPHRTHEAVVAAGGSHASTAWQFPLPRPGLALTPQAVMDHWNAATDGNAASLLEEHLVRRIRTWRPEVVITENVSPRGEDPLAHVTNQVVLAAVEKAADPSAYPEQHDAQGLEAWKVKKVFSVQAGSRQGTVNFTPSQWSARLARSLADVAESGRALLVEDVQSAPVSIGLSLLVDHLPQNTGRRDVFSGLVLLPGGEARRQTIEPPAGDLDKFAKAAQKRHNVQQLLSRVGQDASQAGAMLAQLDELTDGIGDRGAGEILYEVARRYHHVGQSEAAAETLQLLLQRFPQHPLSDAAALWLVQYYSSREMALRLRKTSSAAAPAVAGAENSGSGEISAVRVASLETDVKPEAPSPKGESRYADRAGRAVAIGKLVERRSPVLFADPRFRFPLLSAYKAQDQGKLAQQFFTSLASTAGDDPWGRCAVAEQCLQQGRGVPPKMIVPCVSASKRPRLDGRLDDELWQAARQTPLASPKQDDASWPAACALAFDDEFLYVAVSCRKSAAADYALDDSPRPHDADLSARDRVEFHFDIDRDYATYWTLVVDCRGFTSDRLFGDATWNPTWYVARGGDDQYWTAEIAIPHRQIAWQPPKARDAWAVGIQRIVPNVGFQSATQPADVAVRPEGFGLLVFE
jgi:photosystem II stability/assembly factor-like uncharacterized protein